MKPQKLATCPCGAGDKHSLRAAGICDGIRNGHLTQGQAQLLLDKLGRGDVRSRRVQSVPLSSPVGDTDAQTS